MISALNVTSPVNPYTPTTAARQPAESTQGCSTDRVDLGGASQVLTPAACGGSGWRNIMMGVAMAACMGLSGTAALAQTAPWAANVMVGAPTVSLESRIPSPVYRPSPVAVEIAKGVGFGIDGHTLVVSDAAPAGTKIEGHLDGGTYPQRDFTVSHEGGGTQVNGYFSGQNYTMSRDGGVLRIGNENPEFSSTVSQADGSTVVDGPKEAQHYDIHPGAGGTVVQGLERVVVRPTAGGGTKISSPERDLSYQITPTPGGLHIEGSHKYNSYDVTFTDHGFVIQGAFPAQRVVVTTPE